jgi:O-antigen/teichoic acid export membrane protein
VYNVIIGRRYTAEDLGYYYQANKFQSIPSSVIGTTISGVSYPVLSQLNNEEERQLVYFRKIIRVTAFLIFPVMIILFSMLENLVVIILTDKWLPAVPYFKILAVSAIIFPFHSLNLNILAVKGYAKIYFWLELFRNALCIIFLLLAFLFLSLVPSSDDPSFAIKIILVGYSFASFISYIADSIYVQKKTTYKILQQAKDILPYAAISGIMFLVVKCIGLLSFGLYATTVLQIVAAACFYFSSLKILGSKVLEDVLEIWKKRN